MNASTSQPTTLDFPKQVVEMFLNVIDESTRKAYRMIWDGIIQIITEHWGWIILILIGFLVIAIMNYFVTGRWAMLGSILYNYLYAGFLFLVALVFGPEVFANDWFKIVLFIVYVICFVLVGKILKKVGIRR